MPAPLVAVLDSSQGSSYKVRFFDIDASLPMLGITDAVESAI
ncbi:hypothetical protein ACCUM_1416 [Candidatus Accumulibacter phosphatis]|uniref:Uncharacterized protein n=1 Tax=Candidatus Accumulibacter phosphatis TaxID=327160 RepID=A0A5S4F3L9_9PROT|nr:hypothetical protein ACCUM_1416 [Candidatus Accumulibacter phosphatis]